MTTCPYCAASVPELAMHYVTCAYIDNALGSVKPEKRTVKNICASPGCKQRKAAFRRYCEKCWKKINYENTQKLRRDRARAGEW